MGVDDVDLDGLDLDGDALDDDGLGDDALLAEAARDEALIRSLPSDSFDLNAHGIGRPAVGPLGRALRTARRQKLLSQAGLAKAAGVHQTQVSKIELGAPNWALFCKLIEILGGEPVVTVKPLDPDKEKWERLRASIW